MNPQAEELNEIIKQSNPAIYELLAEKGRNIFFPKKGILSQAGAAKGKKINATIGIALEEDGSPMRLKSIAKKIKLEPGEVFPYAPSYGKPELRNKWKEMIFDKNPGLKGKQVSLPVVTNALTHGLSMLGYLFVNQGDTIILPDKFWGNYKLIFINGHGAKLDSFDTFKGQGFNVEGLKEKLDTETGKKIILLNFPNNPTGYTPLETEVPEIKKIILEAAQKGNKILVIIDDAYFGLVYRKNVYKESIFSELADLHENVLAVKVDGATKEDYVWGLRVGFLTFGIKGGTEESYKALESKAAGAIRGNISNDSHLSQSLVYHAFGEPRYQSEKKKKYDILKKRYKEVERILKEHKEYRDEFLPLPHNSGYFMCIQPVKDAEKIRQILLEKYDTGVIAAGGLIRVAFSSVPKQQLAELYENIYRACKCI